MKGEKYLLPIMSFAAAALALWHVSQGQTNRADVQHAPPIQPASSPFEHHIVATGVIEASSKNIEVGAPVAGVVAKVFVGVGQATEAGDSIYQIDDRSLRGQLRTLKAEANVAQARLSELSHYPRAQEIPIAEAKIALAAAEFNDFQDRLKRLQGMRDENVATKREVKEATHAVAKAAARLRESRAELQLLRAGVPQAAKDIAYAELLLAQARIDRIEKELDRLTIRSPISGQVLLLEIRPGEYVSPASTKPFVVVGSTESLHVLVQIDEHQIHRFRKGARAIAMLRGREHETLPLKLVRTEPMVMPKRTLTGGTIERVDTRVLRVLYLIDADPPENLFVGRQIDVFIEAEPPRSKGDELVREEP